MCFMSAPDIPEPEPPPPVPQFDASIFSRRNTNASGKRKSGYATTLLTGPSRALAGSTTQRSTLLGGLVGGQA